MAFASVSSPSISSLLVTAVTPMRLVWEAMASVPRMTAQAREVDRLLQLSDAELAARGLSRDTIAQHVFKDLFDA